MMIVSFGPELERKCFCWNWCPIIDYLTLLLRYDPKSYTLDDEQDREDGDLRLSGSRDRLVVVCAFLDQFSLSFTGSNKTEQITTKGSIIYLLFCVVVIV
ncbi:hypothetical protein HanPI659440_Chr01g0007011 [Helianthus annuus]|nr:hypothetical protein HanPI659440_Chr01g0007011 [Helianthus annuus]